ncbi:hypothetical protein, partial [Corynebacterium diphtheriae]|uniref:hypothetical protein n=1 Tax=Corynebacterium diphtheriae TaxID=1717 RepID=UPI000D3F120A
MATNEGKIKKKNRKNTKLIAKHTFVFFFFFFFFFKKKGGGGRGGVVVVFLSLGGVVVGWVGVLFAALDIGII